MAEMRGLRDQAALGAEVSIRVSPRARRVGLRIDATERKVEVILPRGVAVKTGLRFLEAKRDWVAARLEAITDPCGMRWVSWSRRPGRFGA